jgi:hypothetical protein
MIREVSGIVVLRPSVLVGLVGLNGTVSMGSS